MVSKINTKDLSAQLNHRYDIGFVDVFIKEKAKVFIFGGLPRDLLMERLWKDADFCICIPVEIVDRDKEVERIFDKAKIHVQSKTKLGPDITIFRFLDQKSKELIDVRAVSDVWAGAIDFTINSLRIDLDTGEMLDRYGGFDDIVSKVIRTPKELIEKDNDFGILFRAIKASCQFKDFEFEEDTFSWIKSRANQIDGYVRFIVENDTDFVEWAQGQMFAGLRYDPEKYFCLIKEFGAVPFFASSFSRLLKINPDDIVSQKIASPIFENHTFEFYISAFLSEISRKISESNAEVVFENIVDLLKIKKDKIGDDFLIDVTQIVYWNRD